MTDKPVLANNTAFIVPPNSLNFAQILMESGEFKEDVKQGPDGGDPYHIDDAWVSEVATNIRRVLKKMSRLVEPCNDANSEMIDLINHADALAQQIEGETDD